MTDELSVRERKFERIESKLESIEEAGEDLQELMSDLDGQRGTSVPLAWNGDGSSDDMTQWLQNAADELKSELVLIRVKLDNHDALE